MSESVTIRDIATATGYSRSTVSAALRGRSDISAKTRERIRTAAEEMGYVQDPEVQRLMTHLRKGKSDKNRIPLALLATTSTGKGWEKQPWNLELWKGVRSRCQQLGFTVEIADAVDLERKGKSLFDVLKARGIQGIILEGSFDPGTGVGKDAENFAVVRLGTHPWKTPFHSACPDFAYNLHVALDALNAKGFRRPGLALTEFHEHRSDDLYLAGFLSWWARHRKGEVVLSPLEYSDVEGRAFREWLKQESPDVVLVNDHHVPKWSLSQNGGFQSEMLKKILHWLFFIFNICHILTICGVLMILSLFLGMRPLSDVRIHPPGCF